MPAVRRTGSSTRWTITRRKYGRLSAETWSSRSIRFRGNEQKGNMMEGKPKYRGVAERPVETRPETSETSRAGQAGRPKKPKLNWKSLLAAAVAIVIVRQLHHPFIGGGEAPPP